MKKSIILGLLLIGTGAQAKSSGSLSENEKQSLELAVQQGNWDPGVKNIITSKNINAPITGAGWSTFIYASYKGRTEIMTGLYAISERCVEHTTPAGGTALMEAARSGNLKSMEWFKEKNLLNIYLNKKDSYENSPLTQAIFFKKKKAVKWLLKQGARIDKRSKKAALNSKSIKSLLKKYEKKNIKKTKKNVISK